MGNNTFNIYELLMFLDIFELRYQIERFSAHSLTVMLAFPKERIEIECMDNDTFQVSLFSEDGMYETSLDSILEKIENEAELLEHTRYLSAWKK